MTAGPRSHTPNPSGDASTNLRYNRYEHHHFDLVVCGGGLAGTCSAILAARQGLKVALVQDRPVLGGNSSSEIRVGVHGAATYWPWAAETGPICEVMDEERFVNSEAVFEGSTNSMWDLVLYDAVVREQNLTLLLNTSARGVELAADGRLESVRCSQLGSEKELALHAPLFVDATGDGTVAAVAGAQWRIGRESRDEFGEPKAPEQPDDVCQGSTVQFHAVDMGRPVPFTPPDWAVKYPNDDVLVWRNHNSIRGGYWWIEIGHPYHQIDDYDRVRHELMRHVLGVWDHIKNHCEHSERAANLQLDWVGTVPGKRESRRIMGPHVLTEREIHARTLFADRVTHGGWFLDEHVKGGVLAIDQKPEQSAYEYDIKDLQQCPVYSIPLSSLVSRDVGNVMLAGRDISASHMALMSTRVMGTCAAIGQAVGAAAVVCKARGCLPAELAADAVAEVQQLLLKEDHYVPHMANDDPLDLARSAKVSATSDAPLALPEGDKWLELDCPTEQTLPVSAGRVDAVELLLDNRTGGPVELTLSLRPRALDIWDATAGPDAEVGRCTAVAQPGQGWVRFEPKARVARGLWGVKINAAAGVFWNQRPQRQSDSAPPPGTAVAKFRKSGCWRFEGLRGNWPGQALRIEPQSRPFQPESVTNGIARPESWPNCWMSNPADGMPASLTLELGEPADVAEVRLTFDNNLGRGVRSTPPLFVAPELVRDYTVELLAGGQWQTVVQEIANRRRHRVHRFDPHRAEAVRLTVTATNGAPEARVYEVRIYAK